MIPATLDNQKKKCQWKCGSVNQVGVVLEVKEGSNSATQSRRNIYTIYIYSVYILDTYILRRRVSEKRTGQESDCLTQRSKHAAQK